MKLIYMMITFYRSGNNDSVEKNRPLYLATSHSSPGLGFLIVYGHIARCFNSVCKIRFFVLDVDFKSDKSKLVHRLKPGNFTSSLLSLPLISSLLYLNENIVFQNML